MKSFTDLFKKKILLTEENRRHILNRLELLNQEDKIKETLLSPELIKKSVSDDKVIVYYKHYQKTPVTSKYMAVIVKFTDMENFIISAYFTDRIKKGDLLWKKN